MRILLLAHNIVWDTDGDVELGTSLPTEILVEIDLSETSEWSDINDDICDQLSNQTGYCVEDYKLEGHPAPTRY
jgi:hypothetical protein